jgi:hypothetical protein
MECIDQEALQEIALDPRASYNYAYMFIQKPFPLGESAIARSSKYSFRYAINVLGARFKLGEEAIKRSLYRHQYKEYFNIEKL